VKPGFGKYSKVQKNVLNYNWKPRLTSPFIRKPDQLSLRLALFPFSVVTEIPEKDLVQLVKQTAKSLRTLRNHLAGAEENIQQCRDRPEINDLAVPAGGPL
jgi:hypothetical protein